MRWYFPIIFLTVYSPCLCSDILMITMGGTKSHKIPFWELARGLIAKNHSITFMSAFPADFYMDGLEEITPAGLVFFVRNYTNWDLVGAKMRGEEPLPYADVLRYPHQSCDAFLDDHETKDLIHSGRRFDLIILDGAYPECGLGVVDYLKVPFMYINSVAMYIGSISRAGSPAPYSVSPFFSRSHTDEMNLMERLSNTTWQLIGKWFHYFAMSLLQDVLKKHFGPNVPDVYELSKNVSFILHNGHYSVSYSRPFLPNVAEIACIHCKQARPLKKELEEFINRGGDSGFVFVSMGSSVKTSNMPDDLRRLFLRAFTRLPYQVLWKWEDERDMNDLPQNVMLSKWLPQQDLLGHPKIRAFVTHGGLLSMFETVFHGVPVVSMPVFCDHESNAAKAEKDGYALKLEFHELTSDSLFNAIIKIIHDPKYKRDLARRQILLKDQKESPLERAVYWTEYVIRHKGAKHLLSPARNLNYIEYYSIDTISILLVTAIIAFAATMAMIISLLRYFVDYISSMKKSKKD